MDEEDARNEIADLLWSSVPSADNEEAKALAAELLDAYRAEVLRGAAAMIRAERPEAPEGFTFRSSYLDAWSEGRNDAANLIDPDQD